VGCGVIKEKVNSPPSVTINLGSVRNRVLVVI
jgi:hypothetical protein